MEQVLANLSGRIRQAVLHGRTYYVAPMTLIVPGVLAGSQGPLYYPPEEVGKDPSAWNGMPITGYHPIRNGVNISARSPDVYEQQQIGTVFNSTALGGNLTAEGWFDIEAVRKFDTKNSTNILNMLEKGETIPLSTGLFTDNEPAPEGAVYNSPKGPRPFSYIARNYRPDHLAILPGERGACSIEDGCGVLINLDAELGKQLGIAFNAAIDNVFCPTGEGGGVDASCSPSKGGSSSGGESSIGERQPLKIKTRGMVVDVLINPKKEDVVNWVKANERKNITDISGMELDGKIYIWDSVDESTGDNVYHDDIGISQGRYHIPGKDRFRITSSRGEPKISTYAGTEKDSLITKWARSIGLTANYIKNAAINQPRSKNSGKYKQLNAGTGKGPVHESAQSGALHLTDEHKELGKDAQEQAFLGHNPPNWAIDEGKWEKAKGAAEKSGHTEDWPYVVAIYQKMGGTVSKSSPSTNKGTRMDRKNTIQWLVTNCSCWKGKEKVLNSDQFTDMELAQIKANAEKQKQHEAVVNAVKEGFGEIYASRTGNDLTIDKMPRLIANAAESLAPEEEEEEEEEEVENCGDEMPMKNKTKNKVKNKTKNESKPGALKGSGPGDSRFDAAMARMREEGELDDFEENSATKNTKNMKKMSTNEWLELAPPEVRSVVKSAIQVEGRERKRLVTLLTANVADPTNKEQMAKKLMGKPVDELRELLSLIPQATSFAVHNRRENEFDFTSYLGNSAPDVTVNSSGGDDDKDMDMAPIQWGKD